MSYTFFGTSCIKSNPGRRLYVATLTTLKTKFVGIWKVGGIKKPLYYSQSNIDFGTSVSKSNFTTVISIHSPFAIVYIVLPNYFWIKALRELVSFLKNEINRKQTGRINYLIEQHEIFENKIYRFLTGLQQPIIITT